MARYTLDHVAPTTWHIKTGRKKIGHVSHLKDGSFAAWIGADRAAGTTLHSAYERVLAKALGFATPAELAHHNANIRAQHRRAMRELAGDLREMIGRDLLAQIASL